MNQNDDKEFDINQFGWLPEIVGILGVLLLVWFLITFARGSI